MKSVISRLEALEAKGIKPVVLRVRFKDGHEEEMGAKQFCKMDKCQVASGSNVVTVVSGDNKRELLEVSDAMREIIKDLFNHPMPNRDISDYE